jgi:putative ABC transport system permease protein
MSNLSAYRSLDFMAVRKDGGFESEGLNFTGTTGVNDLEFVTAAQYEALTGVCADLQPDEVLAYSSGMQLGESFTLFGTTYRVAGRISEAPVPSDSAAFLVNTHFFVLSDEPVRSELFSAQAEEYRDENPSEFEYHIRFDLDGTDEEKLACSDAVAKVTGKSVTYTTTNEEGEAEGVTYFVTHLESRQSSARDFYGLYGGFLFLGLFLGALFLMATVLIIYYKQVAEGYEDKERFEILQKVGMSRQEVRAAIRSQVLTVFFLPILMSVVHIAAAFKMITKLLAVLNLTNVPLFFACTVGTVLAFGCIYALVYALTARAYYRIVS